MFEEQNSDPKGPSSPVNRDSSGSSASNEAPKTLLIVDDEEMLVELLRRMVDRCGYKAIVAKSGDEGRTLYNEFHERIDLVITDLVMPGKDGAQLALELLQDYPGVRILISTGYSATNDISSLLEAGVMGVVMKPYQSEQLLEKIREAIETPHSEP